MKPTVTIDVQPKAITRKGVKHVQTNTQGTYNARFTPAKSSPVLHIWGVCTNRVAGPQTFDRFFSIGDEVEYGSWNLKYTGKIVAIGPKSVTVKHYAHSEEVTRLDLFEFIDRNWDFDSSKTAAYNAEEMLCI